MVSSRNLDAASPLLRAACVVETGKVDEWVKLTAPPHTADGAVRASEPLAKGADMGVEPARLM